jgi:hypothetical protein
MPRTAVRFHCTVIVKAVEPGGRRALIAVGQGHRYLSVMYALETTTKQLSNR